MTPWWLTLLREQQRSQFADFGGAHVGLHLPIPDRLLTDAVARALPATAPIRTLDIEALDNNEFAVKVKMKKPAILPAIRLRLRLEEQPRLPDSPVLTLRFASGGLSAVAAPLLRQMASLPRGMRLEGDRLLVHLGILATQYGLEDVLPFLRSLKISTERGRFIIALDAGVSEP
jgi:hypothetical protein